MKRTHRRAITILEMTVSLMILGAVVLIGAQLLATAQQLRRSATRRAAALEEAANIMDRLAAASFDELSQIANEQKLSAETSRRLPGAVLHVDVSSEDENASAKRIMIEITWREMYGDAAPPVRLTAWRYSSKLAG